MKKEHITTSIPETQRHFIKKMTNCIPDKLGSLWDVYEFLNTYALPTLNHKDIGDFNNQKPEKKNQ